MGAVKLAMKIAAPAIAGKSVPWKRSAVFEKYHAKWVFLVMACHGMACFRVVIYSTKGSRVGRWDHRMLSTIHLKKIKCLQCIHGP